MCTVERVHPAHCCAQLLLSSTTCSFAVVIQQLPNPLRDAVCVFYLVLRGLDTVEDDMALDNGFKLPHLLAFHQNIYKRRVVSTGEESTFGLQQCAQRHST
jgi:phytoene/squalene synthetase